MSLNLLHIHKIGSQLFSHGNSVSGSAAVVCGTETCQIRLVLYYHLGVCPESAGSQHHCRTVDGKFPAVLVCRRHSAHFSAVVNQNLLRFGLKKHRNVQLCHLVVESLYQHGAYSRCIGRSVDTLYAGAAEHAYHA